MPSPNYAALLQELWIPAATTAEPKQSEPEILDDGDIFQFLGDQLLWQETIVAQAAKVHPLPKSLPTALKQALQSQGIETLYSHQRMALKAIRAGKDVVLTPPTASGKTWAAYVGILEGCMTRGDRCLSFYGLKALASDQNTKLNALLEQMSADQRPVFAKMTGDTSEDERKALLNAHPHVIALTPELLHYQLRTVWRSQGWQHFLSHLRYILVDEMHSFNGVYGANMALLLRRLKLAVDRYGGNSNNLQFIFLSATCGNPTQLAHRLSGREQQTDPKRLIWIKISGASTPEKQLLVTQPTHNANAETAKLMVFLLRQELRGITFCNAREVTKTLAELVRQECQLQHCDQLARKVAVFYGSLSDERRAEIIQQLETGQITWIIGTEALEAGIDLPVLDCAIVRGFPGSLMSFWQRIGRAGRKNKGLAVYIPIAQNLVDVHFTERDRLFAASESISFNPNYPILLAKHLLCAAVETGIQTNQLKPYFGTEAVKVAKMLTAQGHLLKGRNGLYAKGFPHSDINFRGGVGQGSFKLIEVVSGRQLEEMNDEIAYREVFPGAIYRRQDGTGQMLTYRSESLDLTQRLATLTPIDDGAMFTNALTHHEAKTQSLLTQPMQVSLNFPVRPESQLALETSPAHLTFELAFGILSQMTTGYQLMTRQYERTCLNKRCIHYRESLPNTVHCPACSKRTREAEIVKVVTETAFPKPYEVSYSTPILKLSLNADAQDYLRKFASEAKAAFEEQPIPPQYQMLWDYPAVFVALHSLGHQLMAALPLVVLASRHDLDFVVEQDGSSFCGLFYDTTDGGNGATEGILKNLPKLVKVAAELAQSCDCEYGCPKCLIQYGCPDGNRGLLKQMGLLLLEAIAA
jgi:DEAD/DEAH box helicase domain-containing protein